MISPLLLLNSRSGFFVWFPKTGLTQSQTKDGLEVTCNSDNYSVKCLAFGCLFIVKRVDKPSGRRAWRLSHRGTQNFAAFLQHLRTIDH